MEGDNSDPLSSGYGLSLFFALTDSSEYLAELYKIRKEAERSYYFDCAALQDSFRFRALNRARAIANRLIDEKGECDKENLNRIVKELAENGYAFYPEGMNDSILTEHMLRFLKRLSQDESLIKSIKRFHKPLCHRWAERLVLDTLGLYQETDATLSHIRRAALCVCLTPIRQSVGSCFATAPAIIIQREQVDILLDDLYELLSTGKLKRIYGGKEYAVPLSPNIGAGDLRKNLFHLDSKARIWFSPSLIAACEMLGIIPSDLSLAKKTELLRGCLPQFTKEKQKMSIEELIRAIVCEQMGVEEKDIVHAPHISRSQIKALELMPHPAESGLSRHLETLEQFRRKEALAKAAFMGECDNALLKAWEYTIASYSDAKMEFSRWNLYKSLGFSTDEHGGIGELLFKHIDQKLHNLNAKIEQFQQESMSAFDATKTAEVLLRQAGSETEARRLQAEYQTRAYHMQACIRLRDDLYAEATHYSTFFSFLLEKYDALFPEYFQEIYDPNMVQLNIQPHEDSLAGFRLVYKHGRNDPSQWTLIDHAEQYIHSLIDFFSTIEPRIAVEINWEEGKKELVSLTTALIAHLRSDVFINSALQRTAQAHGLQEKNASGNHNTPWAYISGGGVETLLKTYFCRESEYTTEEKRVENESELLIFVADAIKGLKPLVTDPFMQDSMKGMLMTSPSHAFVLFPGSKKLAEGWQENGFTYTWVRDQVFLPSQQFYANIHLSQVQQIFLLDAFCSELPPMLSHDLHRAFHADPQPISIPTFRHKMLEILIASVDAKLAFRKRAFTDGLDAFFFQMLPIVPGSEWKSFVKQLLSDLYDDACREFLYPLINAPCAYISAKKIKELAAIIYVQSRRTLFSSFDLHQYIADHARFIGLAPPTSLIIADTNWPNQYFGFVVNPGTTSLEFWSLDRTASQGTPMSDWHEWFKPANRVPWSLFVHPSEYSYASRESLSKHFQKI